MAERTIDHDGWLAVRTLAIALVVGIVWAVPAQGQGQRSTRRVSSARHAASAGQAAEIFGAGAALATGLTLYFAESVPPPAPHWRGGIVLDDAVRGVLRLSSPDDRRGAAAISDVTLVATMTLAAFDGLLPLLAGDPRLALRAETAYALAMGLTLSLGSIVKRVVARARPDEVGCVEGSTDPQCTSNDRYQSFYSLHSGVAFTSAGVSCAMHLSFGAYGETAADGASCGVSIVMAALTGALRIASDRHYLSDVLVGAGLGFAMGYLMTLLVANAPSPEERRHQDGAGPAPTSLFVLPMIDASPGPGATTFGLSATGTF